MTKHISLTFLLHGPCLKFDHTTHLHSKCLWCLENIKHHSEKTYKEQIR